jgi:hypothetical protein
MGIGHWGFSVVEPMMLRRHIAGAIVARHVGNANCIGTNMYAIVPTAALQARKTAWPGAS